MNIFCAIFFILSCGSFYVLPQTFFFLCFSGLYPIDYDVVNAVRCHCRPPPQPFNEQTNERPLPFACCCYLLSSFDSLDDEIAQNFSPFISSEKKTTNSAERTIGAFFAARCAFSINSRYGMRHIWCM